MLDDPLKIADYCGIVQIHVGSAMALDQLVNGLGFQIHLLVYEQNFGYCR